MTNDSDYIKPSERDRSSFAKIALEERLRRSHSVVDDIARELAEASERYMEVATDLINSVRPTLWPGVTHATREDFSIASERLDAALDRYDKVMGNEE